MRKVALVTGGSRGIGRAICVQLAQMGYDIIVNYNANEEAALATQELIQAIGVRAYLLQFDVADTAAIQQAIRHWQSEQDKQSIIEILVNNAGIRNDALMAFMDTDMWTSVLDTSLGGMFYVTKEVLQPMVLNRYGRIINIVSLSGIKGLPGQVNYSAAKAGMIGATKALAQEVAKRNITVNAVAPGFIKTDMTSDLDEAELKKMIPMNRFGTPQEVAALVGFLASKEASYITGQVFSINGGLHT